jgi:hypothetical protein
MPDQNKIGLEVRQGAEVDAAGACRSHDFGIPKIALVARHSWSSRVREQRLCCCNHLKNLAVDSLQMQQTPKLAQALVVDGEWPRQADPQQDVASVADSLGPY